MAVLVIDVKDVALLHVAAVLDPDVKNERIQAWGHKCNWNDILAAMRKLRPQHKLVSDFPNLGSQNISTDSTLPLALLKKWGNEDGWRSLEKTVADNLMYVE